MRHLILFVGFACVFAAILVRSHSAEPETKQRPSDAPRKVKVTISKETTFITEPLRPDGYPDYVAALDRQRKQGITNENNAAVPLMQAFGPGIIPETIRHDVLTQLELLGLDEKAAYALSKAEMIRWWRTAHPAEGAAVSDDELDDQFDRAESQPWSSREFPIVVEWLTFNRRPVELAQAASQRPKFYYPALAEPGSLGVMSTRLSLPQDSRAAAGWLITRAMRRLGNGDAEGAWSDLMACHRLARLVAQGSCLVEAIIGYAIEQMALSADCVAAHYAKADAKQAARMQAELAGLAPLPSVAEKIEFGERIAFLDAVVYIASHQSKESIQKMVHLMTSGESPFISDKEISGALLNSTVDWDIPLRLGNASCGRIVAVSGLADRRKRRIALLDFERELKKLAKSSDSISANEKAANVLMASFLPPLVPAATAEDRVTLLRRMAATAFALSAYRADRGQYPDRLTDLLPGYLAELPDDTFAAKAIPIKYRRDGDAYILWSVGENGMDDGGRTDEDRPPADDIVLRPIRPPHR